MPIDMTPEAIERRLRLVSEARRLGLSLRSAGLRIGDASAPNEDRERSLQRERAHPNGDVKGR